MNAAVLQEWLQTGLNHHQAGRWDEAAKWYAKVRVARPRNFDALHLDGTRALQQGKYDEAVKLLRLAQREGPQSAVCTMRLGIALYMHDRNAEAETPLREAARLDPRLAEAPFHLGQALRRLGRLEEAAAAFSHAIALNQTMPRPTTASAPCFGAGKARAKPSRFCGGRSNSIPSWQRRGAIWP
jgi:protein O-GlcNAc transferase